MKLILNIFYRSALLWLFFVLILIMFALFSDFSEFCPSCVHSKGSLAVETVSYKTDKLYFCPRDSILYPGLGRRKNQPPLIVCSFLDLSPYPIIDAEVEQDVKRFLLEVALLFEKETDALLSTLLYWSM